MLEIYTIVTEDIITFDIFQGYSCFLIAFTISFEISSLHQKLTVLMQILASYLVSLTYHKVNINTFIKSMFVYEIATLPRTASLSFGLACRDSSRQICSQIINVYAQALPSSTWLPAYGWYGDAVGVH